MTHTLPATAIEAATPVLPKRTLWRTLGVLIVGLAMLPSDAVAGAADAPAIAAWASCAWGSADCNVCVADAAGAIGRLRSAGDGLAFKMNGAPDVSLFQHWEGSLGE